MNYCMMSVANTCTQVNINLYKDAVYIYFVEKIFQTLFKKSDFITLIDISKYC